MTKMTKQDRITTSRPKIRPHDRNTTYDRSVTTNRK